MFDLSGVVDIRPGDTVSMSNGTITKTTVVTELPFSGLGLINDTDSGIAAPNSYFDIWACGPDGCPVRHVLVDESGNWSVDFAQPGAGSDEQGTVDITPGTWIDSREADSDSDGTMYGINAPFPTSGSATGEGWITSPAGAYVANPAFTGKATLLPLVWIKE